MVEVQKQAVTGLTPPQLGEAVVREVWPKVTSVPPLSILSQLLYRTVILAPFAWLPLALFVGMRVAAFVVGIGTFGAVSLPWGRRYTLTNRRLMVRNGPRPKPVQEVSLAEIDDVRLLEGSYSSFFLSGSLEVLNQGKIILTLPAVPEPESFRRAVLNARTAWAGK